MKNHKGIPTVQIKGASKNARRRLNYKLNTYEYAIYHIGRGIYQSSDWADAHSLARRLMSLASETFGYEVLGCHWDFLYEIMADAN